MPEWVNTLLIGAGEAARVAWGGIVDGLSALGHGIDALLNPLLSPSLALLNPPCTLIGDLVYAALSPFPVWFGITLISAATGVLMLIAFRHLSNQDAIVRAKADIKANLLALKLFKDDLRVMAGCQLRLLWAIARLQRYIVTPMLILLLPMMLGLAQMGVRYQWRPLHVGEVTLLRLRLADQSFDAAAVALRDHPGIAVEAGPVPGGGDVVWRVRAIEPGRHTLSFAVGDTVIEKEVVVGDAFERISARRSAAAWTDQLLHPTERRIPPDAHTRFIAVAYSGIDSWVRGANYWVLYYFVISMIVALILKPLFNVKF
jgi:hypothetical protein